MQRLPAACRWGNHIHKAVGAGAVRGWWPNSKRPLSTPADLDPVRYADEQQWLVMKK